MMVTISLDSPSYEVTLFDPVSVVYRDATRQAKGLYHLKHVEALWSGLAYLSRYNSGWFYHNGHIDQLIEIIVPYQIQSFFKFGVQASAKTISFTGIIVRMVSHVLAQVVENLCVLHDGVGFLSQIQKFIELSLNESFGDVVRSKRSPKLVPSDDMIGRLHGVKMIPPYAGSATELLGRKERLVLL
jgi:hypothetical protein